MASASRAAEYYASPAGTDTGNGSLSNPWDIHTVLWNSTATFSHPIQPGDTVWLRGGTYAGRTQLPQYPLNFDTFRHTLYHEGCFLQGTSNQPIIVRNYQNEVPTLDGTCYIQSISNVWFWGLQITLSDNPMPLTLTRADQDQAVAAGTYRKGGVNFSGTSGVKFINCVLHDNYASSQFTDGYGCLILYNGRFASDLPSGHGLYMSGTDLVIKDCILVNNFLNGINLYNQSGGKPLNNITANGNILVGNGIARAGNYNLMAGADSGVTNITVALNILYNKPEPNPSGQAQNILLGQGGCPVFNPTINNNVLMFGGLNVQSNIAGTVTFNRIYSDTGVAALLWGDFSGANWNYNMYQSHYSTPFSRVLSIYWPNINVDFANWKTYTGMEANSTFQTNLPTTTEVIIRTNRYELGRANIAILNWGNSNNVSVDLSTTGLQVNQQYQIRAVQDYFGPTISGTYTGKAISLPMTNWTVRQPRSLTLALADATWAAAHTTIKPVESTFPRFGAFVVLPGSAPPAPPENLRVLTPP